MYSLKDSAASEGGDRLGVSIGVNGSMSEEALCNASQRSKVQEAPLFSSMPDLSVHVLRSPIVHNRSPVKPVSLRDYEEQLSELRKENFNLKLRIYFLEEKLKQALETDSEEVHRTNISLHTKIDSLEADLEQKERNITQLSEVIETLRRNRNAYITEAIEAEQNEWQQTEQELKTKLAEAHSQLQQAKVRILQLETESGNFLSRAVSGGNHQDERTGLLGVVIDNDHQLIVGGSPTPTSNSSYNNNVVHDKNHGDVLNFERKLVENERTISDLHSLVADRDKEILFLKSQIGKTASVSRNQFVMKNQSYANHSRELADITHAPILTEYDNDSNFLTSFNASRRVHDTFTEGLIHPEEPGPDLNQIAFQRNSPLPSGTNRSFVVTANTSMGQSLARCAQHQAILNLVSFNGSLNSSAQDFTLLRERLLDTREACDMMKRRLFGTIQFFKALLQRLGSDTNGLDIVTSELESVKLEVEDFINMTEGLINNFEYTDENIAGISCAIEGVLQQSQLDYSGPGNNAVGSHHFSSVKAAAGTIKEQPNSAGSSNASPVHDPCPASVQVALNDEVTKSLVESERLHSALNDALSQLPVLKEQRQKDIAQLEQLIQTKDLELADLRMKLKDLDSIQEKALRDSNNKVVDLTAGALRLQQLCNSQSDTISTLTAEQERLMSSAAKHEETCQRLRDRVAQFQTGANNWKAKFEVTEEENQNLSETVQELNAKLKDASAEQKQAKAVIEGLNADIHRLEKEKTTLSEQLKQKEQLNEQLCQTIEQCERTVTAWKAKYEELSRDYNERIASMQKPDSQNKGTTTDDAGFLSRNIEAQLVLATEKLQACEADLDIKNAAYETQSKDLAEVLELKAEAEQKHEEVQKKYKLLKHSYKDMLNRLKQQHRSSSSNQSTSSSCSNGSFDSNAGDSVLVAKIQEQIREQEKILATKRADEKLHNVSLLSENAKLKQKVEELAQGQQEMLRRLNVKVQEDQDLNAIAQQLRSSNDEFAAKLELYEQRCRKQELQLHELQETKQQLSSCQQQLNEHETLKSKYKQLKTAHRALLVLQNQGADENVMVHGVKDSEEQYVTHKINEELETHKQTIQQLLERLAAHEQLLQNASNQIECEPKPVDQNLDLASIQNSIRMELALTLKTVKDANTVLKRKDKARREKHKKLVENK